MTIRDGLHLEHSILITAEPVRVLTAFFDASALPHWWKVIRSVTIPRPMGIYAVEWETTPFQDDVLGSLGGIFYGVVGSVRPLPGAVVRVEGNEAIARGLILVFDRLEDAPVGD